MDEYIDYLREVYSLAMREAYKDFVDFSKGIWQRIILAFAGSVALASLSPEGSTVPIVMRNAAIGLMVGVIAWGVTLLVYHTFRSPFVIYKDTKGLADKFTWEEVGFEIYDEARYGVGLKVSNDKPFELQRLVGRFHSLHSDKDGMQEIGYNLPWIVAVDDRPTTVELPPDSMLRLSIANRGGQEAWFFDEHARKGQVLENNAHYTVTIRFRCKVDDQPIPIKMLSLDIVYDGSKFALNEVENP